MDDEAERGRNDGQRRQRPFGIIGIVNGGVGQLCQMPEAPRHDIPAALQIPVMPGFCTQHGGDALRHGGFFGDHKAHGAASILFTSR